MIKNVYNIRDERQGTFGTPIFTEFNPDQVAKSYERSVLELQTRVSRLQEINPAMAAKAVLESAALKDSVIYHVGTFDDQSGDYTSIDPILVCRLSDYFREVSSHA